jgi:hypothetical protein
MKVSKEFRSGEVNGRYPKVFMVTIAFPVDKRFGVYRDGGGIELIFPPRIRFVHRGIVSDVGKLECVQMQYQGDMDGEVLHGTDCEYRGRA